MRTRVSASCPAGARAAPDAAAPHIPRSGTPRALAVAIALQVAAAAVATGDTASPIRFTDVARERGIEFTHTNGASGRFFYPESMGGGVCLFDHDGDGWVDVYFVNGAPLPGAGSAPARDRLFRNRGDGRFEDVTETSGAGDTRYGTGACAADVDNDGDADLCLLGLDGAVLCRNRGGGKLAPAAEIGISGWCVAGVFFDHDEDGFVDLFIARYLDYALERDRPCIRRTTAGDVRDYCGPSDYPGLPGVLLRNRGDGSFEDVSRASGVGALAGKGMGAAACDFDGDGDLDVFVANDQMRSFLWRNDGGGRFTECGIDAGVAYDAGGGVKASMGVAWGDVDGDALFDLFVPCLRREAYPLFRNDGGGLFTDAAGRLGIAAATLDTTGFAAILADFDCDGWVDAFSSSGAVFAREGKDPSRDAFIDCYGEPALLLRNEEGRRFAAVSKAAGPYFTERRVGRGAAAGDLFHDGRLAIVVNHDGGPAALLRNTTDLAGRHWLTLRLVGRRSNRDAIGARVTAHVGARRLVRDVAAGGSVFSQNDLRPHFGLGAGARIDRLVIEWPAGTVQELEGVAADRVLTVEEP